MKAVCYGTGTFLLAVILLKLILVMGVPYVKTEELFYASELSVKKTFKELQEGEAKDAKDQILINTGKILEVINGLIVDNVDYDVQNKLLTVEIRYRYIMPTGQERYAVIKRKVMVNE
ncbi:MAG: hypothetical protein IJT81_07945 [Lachnospiraceae bacterium]|nr:hypothetical protein [Lachnospiraceae bacterium]